LFPLSQAQHLSVICSATEVGGKSIAHGAMIDGTCGTTVGDTTTGGAVVEST
jgi:hypothetical protein